MNNTFLWSNPFFKSNKILRKNLLRSKKNSTQTFSINPKIKNKSEYNNPNQVNPSFSTLIPYKIIYANKSNEKPSTRLCSSFVSNELVNPKNTKSFI